MGCSGQVVGCYIPTERNLLFPEGKWEGLDGTILYVHFHPDSGIAPWIITPLLMHFPTLEPIWGEGGWEESRAGIAWWSLRPGGCVVVGHWWGGRLVPAVHSRISGSRSLGTWGTDKSLIFSCLPPPSFPGSQTLGDSPQSLRFTGSCWACLSGRMDSGRPLYLKLRLLEARKNVLQWAYHFSNRKYEKNQN